MCRAACGCPEEASPKGAIQPVLDDATDRLTELMFDSSGDGRIDTWTEMDGARPLRSRVDTSGDGRIDRWEYYDSGGRLTKVGLSRVDS
jgi:hypothetical protein